MALTRRRVAALSIASLLFSIFQLVPTSSKEVDDEREFSYLEDSPAGPRRWGLIHEEWKECNSGNMQSPIDLLDQRVEVLHALGKLNRSYRPADATIVNRGHDIMLKWEEGAGRLWCNGTSYALKQLHWHSPSEHTINGRRFDLELHMVHETEDNKMAVVGILYKYGRADTFLSDMEKYIHPIKNVEHHEDKVGVVDPRLVKRGSRKYYRYIGSLTVPPCTQGVVWTIVKKVRTVSREQVKLLRDAVNDHCSMNSRPVQPVNNRKVHLYRPETA